MADQTSTSNPALSGAEKGKGKAFDDLVQDVSMGEDDDSSDEETGAEEEPPEEPEEEDADNMEEIDTNNIIETGRRTRGKNIDFAKAAQEAGDDLDSDSEEDEDFEEQEDDVMKDASHHEQLKSRLPSKN